MTSRARLIGVLAGLAACSAAVASPAAVAPPPDAEIARAGHVVALQVFRPRLILVDVRTQRIRRRRVSGELFPAVRSPDGRLIAYQRPRRGVLGRTDVVVAGSLGSRRPRLVLRGATSPAWSPDGRRLAFARNAGIYVTGSGLRGSRRIARRGNATAFGAVGTFVSWAPDGRRLAFLSRVRPAPCSLPDEPIGVGVVPVSGGPVRTLYRPGTSACEPATDIAWSPTGRRVLVNATPGLLSVAANGRSRRLLFPGRLNFPLWFPSGRRIAYLADGRQGCEPDSPFGGRSLCVMTADGGRRRLLAEIPDQVSVLAMTWWQ